MIPTLKMGNSEAFLILVTKYQWDNLKLFDLDYLSPVYQ